MKLLLSLIASNITCGYSGEFPSTDHISPPILFNSTTNDLRTSTKSVVYKRMKKSGGNKEKYALTLSIIVDVTKYNSVELQLASVGSCVIFGGYTSQHKTKARPEDSGIFGKRER